MKAIKLLTTLLILGGLSFNSNAGGPWPIGKKRAFVQGQIIIPAYPYSSMLMGPLIKDVQGVNRRTTNADFGLYIEYGITDKLDIITKVPFKFVGTGALTDQTYFEDVLPAGSLAGLSNYELDLKYAIIDKKFRISMSFNTSYNTISRDFAKGLATGNDAGSLGLTLHVGRAKEKQYGFAEFGFHKYSNNFSDVVKIKVEHGWKLGKKFNLALMLDARHALNNGKYFNANLAQTGLYPNDQSWAVISAKVNYEFTKGWGFNVGLPLVPLRFKYVGFNGAVAMGIYKKLN